MGYRFAANMAGADIYHAASGPGAKLWDRGVYYADCHHQGGADFAWMRQPDRRHWGSHRRLNHRQLDL